MRVLMKYLGIGIKITNEKYMTENELLYKKTGGFIYSEDIISYLCKLEKLNKNKLILKQKNSIMLHRVSGVL